MHEIEDKKIGKASHVHGLEKILMDYGLEKYS